MVFLPYPTDIIDGNFSRSRMDLLSSYFLSCFSTSPLSVFPWGWEFVVWTSAWGCCFGCWTFSWGCCFGCWTFSWGCCFGCWTFSWGCLLLTLRFLPGVVVFVVVSVAHVAEPQASVDIAVAFVVLVPVSVVVVEACSSGHPKFLAFPNVYPFPKLLQFCWSRWWGIRS